MQKFALVTGISGQDGITITHFLLSKGYHVIGTFRRNSQLNLNKLEQVFEEDLKKYFTSRLSFEICEISDTNSVENCIKSILKDIGPIDECYLLAGVSAASVTFKQKDYTIQTNGQAVSYFLEAIKNHTPETKIFLALTSEMFAGHPDKTVVNEQTPFNSTSPYGASKELAHFWGKFYKNQGLFVSSGFLFNHSNQYRGKDFFIRKITNGAARIALGKQKTIQIGNLNFTKNESYCDFVMEAAYKMLQQETPKDYVIGNRSNYRGIDLVQKAFSFFNISDWEKYLVFDENFCRPVESATLICDCSAAEKDLNWNCNRISFDDHIKIMCAYDFDLELGKTPIRPDIFSLY